MSSKKILTIFILFLTVSISIAQKSPEKRIEHFNLYKILLGDRVTYPQWHPEATQNAAYFPVIFESKNQCTRVFQHLEKAGIQCRRYFSPSLNKIEHLSTAKQTDCPLSESLANRTLCLPLFVELSHKDIKKICNTLIFKLTNTNKKK